MLYKACTWEKGLAAEFSYLAADFPFLAQYMSASA